MPLKPLFKKKGRKRDVYKRQGLYNYYRLAINVCNLGKFHSIMRGSCLKTLAAKYTSSVMKMYKKYRSVKGDFGADYKTKSGTKRCEFYNEGFRLSLIHI